MDTFENLCDPRVSDYPAIKVALDILDMFEEIRQLKKQVWELEKELILLRKLRDGYL